MAYRSEVGDGIRGVVVNYASDMAWPLSFSDAIMAEVESAELATFGEYEASESDAEQAQVYQLVRDGVKQIPSPPEGVSQFVAWLDSYAKGAEYAAGAGSTSSVIASSATDAAETVTKAPETLSKLGGGLGALAAGAALLMFMVKR